MKEAEFAFFSIVRVLDSPAARHFELVGREGIVLGRSEEDESTPQSYSVHIDDLSYSFEESELEPTGRSIREEDFYDGSRMGVSPEGEVRWRTEPGEEPPPVVAG